MAPMDDPKLLDDEAAKLRVAGGGADSTDTANELEKAADALETQAEVTRDEVADQVAKETAEVEKNAEADIEEINKTAGTE